MSVFFFNLFKLRCLILVTDRPVRVNIATTMKVVQEQVISPEDSEKMENLGKMHNCGVVVDFENDENISMYLQRALDVVKGKNIFQKSYWFIFLRGANLNLVFRYDSQVFLVREAELSRNDFFIYETYSIDRTSKIIQITGNWTLDGGFGRC